MNILKIWWRKWLVVAQAIGNFQAQIILTIFYLVILLPIGLGMRFFADPFNFKKKLSSNFEKWQHPQEDIGRARKQY